MFIYSKNVLINCNFRKNEAEYQDSYFAYTPVGAKKDFIEISRLDNRLAVELPSTLNLFCKDSFINKFL